jgi:hypothetical protein
VNLISGKAAKLPSVKAREEMFFINELTYGSKLSNSYLKS